eukprot:12913570-Prorocentrum_lima.AAC.1
MARGVFLFNTPEAMDFFAAVEHQMGSQESGHLPGQGDQIIQEGNQPYRQREAPLQAAQDQHAQEQGQQQQQMGMGELPGSGVDNPPPGFRQPPNPTPGTIDRLSV